MLSLASLSEGSSISDIGEGTNPLENQELFQDFNPFELLSNLQIGSTSLINPDWSITQSLTMSLVGGGLTNNSPTQMEEDTLDLVFVSVIPYTGD
jgi:PPE-repeat protein